MNRVPCPLALLLIPLALACFALSPQARADCQEGCDLINANTFLGEDALLNNIGASDTAVGWHALRNNPGSWNTAIGAGTLENNGGYDNTATGFIALQHNAGGHSNTATGSNALLDNTTGSDNTATGFAALSNNTTGNFNVANGMWALSGNTIGVKNTATGYGALTNNTTGDRNTATGLAALVNNTTGNNNTANGVGALYSNTTGSNNIALGYGAGGKLTIGVHNIDIGNEGVAGESGSIRIGTAVDQTATFIAGISGVTVPDGVGVIIGNNGKLGTVVSSERFKDEIKPMDKASEAILALKPVTFRYKHELDPVGIPQFGLVAEQVEKVNPDLVARDAQGKPYTVRYEAVNAMLLNEFLKQHRKVEDQQATITELKSTVTQQKKDFQATVAQLTARLDEQASQIQKVSVQLEASKPAPQMVVNNH